MLSNGILRIPTNRDFPVAQGRLSSKVRLRRRQLTLNSGRIEAHRKLELRAPKLQHAGKVRRPRLDFLRGTNQQKSSSGGGYWESRVTDRRKLSSTPMIRFFPRYQFSSFFSDEMCGLRFRVLSNLRQI